LHRFVAHVLANERELPGFGSGELAYHSAEGGLEREAAAALIDAAKAAANTGFQRVALRLLATAVKLDSSVDIRRAARELARMVDASISPVRAHAAPPPPPPAAGAGVSMRPQERQPADDPDEYEELKSEDLKPAFNMAQSAMRSAIQALEQEDFDGAERWLDAAVAAGFGKAAAQRVLAITQLARGEMHHATQTLQRAHSEDAPPSVRARDRLSWALVRMTTGDVLLAVRDALDALALSRRIDDTSGQLAAMHVLAQCYRLLERAPDAAKIAKAANALRAAS
jgi:tetratricopeptide (TPR) repeat protein